MLTSRLVKRMGLAACFGVAALYGTALRAESSKVGGNTGTNHGATAELSSQRVSPVYLDRAFANGPGGGTSYGVPRGDNNIHSGIPECDDLGVCDLQVGITGGFTQTCPATEGDWVSLAFPVQTDGATICAVNMTHNANDFGGDLYLINDCGGNPDVGDILHRGCGQIIAGNVGPQVYTIDPPVVSGATTWVVAVYPSSFAFNVAYNSAVPGTGLGYGNLNGSGATGSWEDLNNFSFGFCYCVSLEVNTCEAPPSGNCCVTPAQCDGDTDGNGLVDPLDSGGVLARFGFDVTLPGVCQFDLDCNGIIDPLDVGYVLARFGTCLPVGQCPIGGPPGGDCGGASAPANDDCGDAIVALEGETEFSNVGATTDGPQDCDPFTGNYDVWYEYSSPAAGTVQIGLCGDATDFDTTLSAYDGTGCPVGDPLACNDDSCDETGGPSEIVVAVTAGQKVKIRIGGWDNLDCGAVSNGSGIMTITFIAANEGACCFFDTEECSIETSTGCSAAGGEFQGTGTACVTELCVVPPMNDTCDTVVPPLLNPDEMLTFMGDNTNDVIDDCSIFGFPEVWEAFETQVTMNVTIDYCGTGSTFSPVWRYVTSGCPCPDFIGADEFGFLPDCPNGETQFIMTFFDLPPGTYYHPIYAGSDGLLGPYTLNVAGVLPPADCCIVHPQPGCDVIDGEPVEGVDDCVCAVDPFCCESTWDIVCVEEVESLGCADCPAPPPPPPNDNCQDVVPVNLVNGATITFTGDNTGATVQCAGLGAEEAWHAFKTNATDNVQINYCGTPETASPAFIVLDNACPCDGVFEFADAFVFSVCPDGITNIDMDYNALPAATWYIPVYSADDGYIGPYTINVSRL